MKGLARVFFLWTVVCCLLSFKLKATTIASRQTGNWTTTSTWIYYCTGTISFTNGSTTVTGTSTLFTTELANGNSIMLQTSAGTVIGTISSITNNTTLVLSSAATSTSSGAYGKQRAPTDGSSEDIVITSGHVVTTDFSTDFDILSLDVEGTLTHSASNELRIAESLELNGTINGAGSQEIKVNYSNTTGVTLSGTGYYSHTNRELVLIGNVTVPSSANLTFDQSTGDLDLNGKTLTNDGRINILHPATIFAGGTLINNSSTSYLKYTKQADFPGITLTSTASGNTVEYGWASGTYKMDNTTTYHHLILSGGGGTKKSNNNTITVYGNLTIGSGVTLDVNTGNDNIIVYGDWDNDNGGSFDEETTKKVTFAGTANNQTIYTPAGGETFGDLTINNTFGTVTSTGNIYVSNGRTLTLTAGTFDMVTYILDEASGSADFTMTGGDLRLQKLSTTLPQLGGTYTISGGTVTFNGAGSQTIRCETVSSPIVANYNNVVFGGSGVKTLEGNLDVDGNLTISGSAELDVSNTNNSSNIKNITVAGNWSNTSSDADPFIERTGTVTFDGSNDISLTASPVSGGETFYNLIISKSAATEDLTLSNNTTVSNQFTPTLGHVITSSSSQYLILDVSATVASTPTDNSHVVGPMKKNTNSTSAFRFPIGKSGYYRWLEITPVATGATTYTSEYFYDSPASNTSLGAGLDHISDIEYWSLDRSGASPANADVKLSWTSNSVVSTNTTDLRVVQWDGASSWVNRCGGGCTVTGGSTTATGSISAPAVSTFNNSFTLGSPNSNNEIGNTRYSVANGNWSSTAVWALRTGSTPGASAPTSTKRVVIEGGFRVDVDATVSCLGMVIGDNGTGTLDFNATTNDVTVDQTFGLVINSNGDVEGTNTGAELISTGDITLNADVSQESGGGSSAFIVRRTTNASKTLSGTGTADNLDIDASTTNSGSITVNSIFTGSSTLTNTGTLVFKGTNANFAGGSFDASTSGNTVHFNNTTASFDIREVATYHHLILSGNSTKICANDITINGNLTINNSVTLNMDADDKEMVIKGDFINAGTYTPSTNTGREVTFSGSSEQNITSNGSCFFRLYIANTSATGVVLQDNACIQTSGKIDLADGYLYLGNYNMSLQGTPTTPTSASSSSFIVSNGTGTLSATCGNITFPMGTTGSTSAYTPVIINNSGTSDTYSARVCDNVYTDGACSGTAASGGLVNKTWQLTETTAGGSNVSLTLQWAASNENASFDRNNCFISHYTAGARTPVQTETTSSGSGPYTLNATGVSSFSPFAIGTGGALPIELLSFTAVVNSTYTVDLEWATIMEINNDFFTVERSTNGIDFEKLVVVGGAGNANYQINYTAKDDNPYPGISYYRLKQTDFDGRYTYSKLVAINLNKEKSGFILYPNPTDGRFNLVFSGTEKEEEVTVKLFDMAGNGILSMPVIVNNGSVATISPGELPSGVYIVYVITDKGTYHQKLVIRSAD